MVSVKRCKRCLAEAAGELRGRVCFLRRKPDPGAFHPSDFTETSERQVSFEDEPYQQTPRGRQRTRSSSHGSVQFCRRFPSRTSSPATSISSGFEHSLLPGRHLPTPDPNIALPTPQTTRLRRCISSCHLTFSNTTSRSCMIKASCIPQLEWTRADCRDYVAACFREGYGLSGSCANKQASRQMESGDRIYYTPLWVWLERWPYAGKEMYYRLQECRNKGLVRDVKPERGHMEVIPVEYRSDFAEGQEK